MTEQQNDKKEDWIEKEKDGLPIVTDVLPFIKFEENKPKTLVIDFSIPFQKKEFVDDNGKKVMKAQIPCTENGVKSIWSLNRLSPIYRNILDAGKNGQTTFNVMRTGTAKKTKWIFVK